MATVDYTVDRLISSIERRGGIPTRQGLYEDSDFVAFLNEAMYQDIVPGMMEVREEYFVSSVDYNVTANTDRYAIPADAIGQKVRSIEFYDPNDVGGTFYVLKQVSIEDIGAYPYNSFIDGSYSGYYNYYLEGNDIVIFPRPRANLSPTTLRVKYFKRPNELVENSEGGS